MAPRTLTEPYIKALKPAPAGQRYAIADALVPGLKVRVTDKGSKSYILWRRFGGAPNPAARALGTVGELSLAEARDKARSWLALIKQGEDPRASAIGGGNDFGSIVEEYFRRHVAKQRRAALENVQHETAALARDTRNLKRPVVTAPPRLVEQPKPEPELRTGFFTLQPVKFEHNGLQQVARFQMVSLNAVQAANAMRMEACCAIDDPRVVDLRKKAGVFERPAESHCFDLDANTRPSGITMFDLQDQRPQYKTTGFRPEPELRMPRAAGGTRKEELPPGFEPMPGKREPYVMVTDAGKLDEDIKK